MAEPWNIRQRKAEEARFEAANAMIAARAETTKQVLFEHRSEALVQRRLVKEQATAMKHRMEGDLRRRRAA